MDNPRPPLRLDTAGGSLLNTALAKSEDLQKRQKRQTYREHVTAVYHAWRGLIEEHALLIERIAKRNQISVERLLKSSLLTVALHDVGKLTKNFQEMMRAVDKAAYRKATRSNYRHEIAGLWVVHDAARALGAKLGHIPGDGFLETLTVAGHHRFVSHDLPDEEQFCNSIAWEPDAVPAFFAARELAKAMFYDQGWGLILSKPRPEDIQTNLSNGPNGNHPFTLLALVKGHFDRPPTSPAIRDLFILLKGLLMTADWMASGAEGGNPFEDVARSVVRVESRHLPDHLQARHERRREDRPELLAYAGFTPFQTKSATFDGHVLGIAPTGSGKTEAALAWALQQVEHGHARKILFLLPTMVTANSIHQRLTDFFKPHEHRVGLIHSTADLVRESNQAEESEADRADVRTDVLGESHFFSPVTVGTIDQLLVPLFHAGRWPLKSFAAADAAIILDEIHAYEPHTLGLIVTMIEQFRQLGARFFIMSATLPSDLRTVLHDALTREAGENHLDVVVIEENTLLDKARNKWNVCETPLSQWLLDGWDTDKPKPSRHFRDLWNQQNDRGEPIRILIVTNTVDRCQALAKALRRYDPVCYHSKFIFRDRREKERRIDDNPPRLLIATQVVEVSLDIDYDILLTECAPFDALVQRAGRVNRTRRSIPGRVIVHKHDEKSERIYQHPVGILDRSWSLLPQNEALLTERQLIDLVEQAYQGFALAQDENFLRVKQAIEEQQRRLSRVLDAVNPHEDDALLKTRPDDYPQISVIPSKFAEIVQKLTPKNRRLYELKMPVWYTRCHMKPQDGIPMCEMKYGPKYGARFQATPKHPEPACEVF